MSGVESDSYQGYLEMSKTRELTLTVIFLVNPAMLDDIRDMHII